MSIVQERQFLLFGEGKQRVEGKVEVEEGGRDEAIDDERERRKEETYRIKFIVLRKMMGESCVEPPFFSVKKLVGLLISICF